jgi:putative acetyltransferase
VSGLHFGPIAPDDPDLEDLIAQHAAHSATHYPAESNHHLDGAALARSGLRMFAGRVPGTRQILAMGGYRMIGPDMGELKSMHVAAVARGEGAGSRILALILDDARRRGLSHLYLETGSRPASAAARRLYAREGFTACPPFAGYAEDPMSVFMVRAL